MSDDQYRGIIVCLWVISAMVGLTLGITITNALSGAC